MTYDPSERLTAREILTHPFLEELYDPENDDQLIEGEPIKLFDFEFEQFSLTNNILKDLILDEVILTNSKEARHMN